MRSPSQLSRTVCVFCRSSRQLPFAPSKSWAPLVNAQLSKRPRGSTLPSHRLLHSSTRAFSAEPTNPASALQSLDAGAPSGGDGSLQATDYPDFSLKEVKLLVHQAITQCREIGALSEAITPDQLLFGIVGAETAAQRISGRESVIVPDPTKERPTTKEDVEINSTSFSRRLAAMKAQTRAKLNRLPVQLSSQIHDLSQAVYDLVKANPEALTQESLRKYANTQCLLQTPESLPEIFDTFSDMSAASWAQRVMNPRAVDASTGFSALNTAILLKNAPLAIAIIHSSLGHSSFRRVKFIKEALPPLGLALITPAVILPAAHRIAASQVNLPVETASTILFAGVMTYLGVLSSMAYVTVTSTITTANRKVEGANSRVSWAPGLALWKRWLGEHERLAMDKVVSAWGFADDRHWGGEEGQEWRELKEVAALRGMQVDANM